MLSKQQVIPLIIFEGGASSGSLHRALQMVRQGAVLDLLPKWQTITAGKIIVVSDDPLFLQRVSSCGAIGIEVAQNQFEFLPVLKQVVRDCIEHSSNADPGCLVIGGGALAAASIHELEQTVQSLSQAESGVWLNNYLSPDVIGWKPTAAVYRVEECRIDNQLGASLRDQAGLAVRVFPRSLGLSFDLDGVRDVQILASSGLGGPHFQEAWDSQPLLRQACVSVDNFARQLAEIKHKQGRLPELLLAGRVGPEILLELRGRFRTRVFSEERGMKGLARDIRGEVRSFLADVWKQLGSDWVLAAWQRMADAAVVDTRVLQSALGIRAAEEDRLWSDLGIFQHVQDPDLRTLTRQLANAPLPVLSGGHSIVSAGLEFLLLAQNR